MKKKIAKYLLFATMALIVISYLPWFYKTQFYYMVRYAIMALMGSTAVLTFSAADCFSQKFLRLFIVTIIVTALEFVIMKVVGLHFVVTDLIQLIITLLCITIGMGLDLDHKTWANICYFYTLGLIILGLVSCYYYAEGFYIPKYYLLTKGKNQIGSMIALGVGSLFFYGMKYKEHKVSYLVLFFLALETLMMIRARTACIALLACVILILIKDGNWKWKWNVKTVISIIGLIFISYILYSAFIGEELKTFFIGGKQTYDLNGISSGRWVRNQQGVQYFLDNPLTGEQVQDSGIKLIHNYVLLRFVRYGIWAFPMIAFYCYFGIKILCVIFKSRKSDINDVGYIVLTISFLISFLEPSFPFGPGSVQILPFLLLGKAFKPDMPEDEEKPVVTERHKILHVCNGFINSKVHSELYKKLDAEGVDQIVYTPFRGKELIGKNSFDGEHTEIIYAPIQNLWHRISFHSKIEKICKDIEKKVDLNDISCIHATTLFSDGAVAWTLKKKYGIPYVVAVRSTDLNIFLKYMLHLSWLHKEIIREADKVVFITPALQKKLNGHWTMVTVKSILQEKSEVIPNGVDDHWIDNAHVDVEQHKKNHNVAFVGLFNSRKNVMTLIDAVLSLKNQIPDIRLNLVGDGPQEQDVKRSVEKHPDVLTYHGKITDKQKLQDIYRSCSVFAMPSVRETFGLVYVEALSQGLTVLYSKNVGIDGLIADNQGERVDPYSKKSIQNALAELLLHPENYQELNKTQLQDFNWQNIALKYKNMYQEIETNPLNKA